MFWVVVLCCKALTANTVLFFKLFASGHLCEAVKRGLEQLLSELRRVHITELIIHSLYHNKPWDQSHSSAAERSVRASSYMDSKTKEGKFIQTKLWMAHTHTSDRTHWFTPSGFIRHIWWNGIRKPFIINHLIMCSYRNIVLNLNWVSGLKAKLEK